jgi:hypothetical protein
MYITNIQIRIMTKVIVMEIPMKRPNIFPLSVHGSPGFNGGHSSIPLWKKDWRYC